MGEDLHTEADVLASCWKPIRENPTDFDAWTHLLQTVESLDETRPAREAYDEFLNRFPYCYGYWKKYAELERRHKHLDRTIDVYERGVSAIYLSIDLWLSYLAFYKDYTSNKDSESRERRTRYLYERAITAAGLEFKSDRLWEDYILWETENKNYPEVTAVYDRLLKIPTHQYAAHFDKFQEFVNGHPPDEILSEIEYEEICKLVNQQMNDKGIKEIFLVEEVIVGDGTDDKMEPGMAGQISAPKTEFRKRYNDEALKAFRIAILDKRRKAHLYNEREVSKRWNYEEGIKRPYFHVKPLERAQLKNWRAYLDFEISEGIHERIVVLFERCLIACCLYEDIWIKYACYMETKSVEDAREIYKRACDSHLSHKPNPHMAWSAFEEKYGNFDAAKQLLIDFDRRCPGLLMIQMRILGVVRRQLVSSSKESGERLDFAPLTTRYEKIIRAPETPTRVASFYALKLARFHAKVRDDRRLAEKILKDALRSDPANSQVYRQLVDMAYSANPFDQSGVVKAFDFAIKSQDLPDEEKLKFSQMKLEFLEDLCTDVKELQEHFEHHLKLAKSVGGSSSKRKSDKTTAPAGGKSARMDGAAMRFQNPRMGGPAPGPGPYPPFYNNYYPQQAQAPAPYVGPTGSYYYPPPY